MKVHPTAIIEEKVEIGRGTSVWDNTHIRHSTTIGEDCIIGGKTYIAYDVKIGDRVKINSFVYVCNAVTIGTGVMIGAGTIFTNDRFPRATTTDLARLRSSEPDEHTLPTLVKDGATIGAHCTVGSDLEIGRFAMIGMGAVVTRSIPDFHLVIGQPARSVGVVCRCGQVIARFDQPEVIDKELVTCPTCSLRYSIQNQVVKEVLTSDDSSDIGGRNHGRG